MLKHLYLVLGSTFFLGFLVGAIVYVQTNSGKEGDGDINESISKGLTITASLYGGCSRIGCPSYRIENDGSYTYIVWSPEGAEVRYEDTLTDKQLIILKSELDQTDFENLLDTEFKDMCPIAYDGVAYRYDIEYKGVRYEVDSCVELLTDEPLFKSLSEYFNIFSILYGSRE